MTVLISVSLFLLILIPLIHALPFQSSGNLPSHPLNPIGSENHHLDIITTRDENRKKESVDVDLSLKTSKLTQKIETVIIPAVEVPVTMHEAETETNVRLYSWKKRRGTSSGCCSGNASTFTINWQGCPTLTMFQMTITYQFYDCSGTRTRSSLVQTVVSTGMLQSSLAVALLYDILAITFEDNSPGGYG